MNNSDRKEVHPKRNRPLGLYVAILGTGAAIIGVMLGVFDLVQGNTRLRTNLMFQAPHRRGNRI